MLTALTWPARDTQLQDKYAPTDEAEWASPEASASDAGAAQATTAPGQSTRVATARGAWAVPWTEGAEGVALASGHAGRRGPGTLAGTAPSFSLRVALDCPLAGESRLPAVAYMHCDSS